MGIVLIMPPVRDAAARPAPRKPGKPFTGKGDPRAGRGPRKGAPNAGRPPEWFKQQLEAGLTREETVDAVHRVLGNENHPQFAAVLRWASERVYGKPVQPVDATVTQLPALPIVRETARAEPAP
jgi:hypothetical protein